MNSENPFDLEIQVANPVQGADPDFPTIPCSIPCTRICTGRTACCSRVSCITQCPIACG
ncbi:hypothetical protein P3102_07330 [Amycolatopsis sp. QT-25]|uniref:hypothetical protein n=1 Tax=Amycolatopsis sp. QT-25 TaxID=3034022 RepID=UPI0023EBC7C0|nr:hypothetical protein [Amycolatopsis sp. QT-25]WET81036.1 hypothetical protein P3102_07330 [Amycolatopsis sp. QT-25]